MASGPATGNTPKYRPLFKRVAQNETEEGIHSADLLGEFACVATVCSVSLDDVRNVAIKKYKHPAYGPFWITQELIQQLFREFGWIASDWRQIMTPLSGITDVAMLAINYDEEMEFGRPVIFQRSANKDDPSGFVEHIIDPAYWVPENKRVTSDIKAYAPAWWMSLSPAAYPSSGIPKAPPPVAKK